MTTELGLLSALEISWSDLAVEEQLNPNHCILATRTAIEVGRYFGFEWSPLPVDLAIFNPAGFDLWRAEVPTTDWPAGAWSIGSACGPQNNRQWEGHMILRTHRHLADLSASQFDRPEKNLRVEPWIIDRPTEEPPWWFKREDETRFTILPRPDVRSYQTGRNWKVNYRPLAARLIRQLRLATDIER